MAFGTLTTSLRADLKQLDADLRAAEKRYRDFYGKVARMGAGAVTGPAGGASPAAPVKQLNAELEKAQRNAAGFGRAMDRVAQSNLRAVNDQLRLASNLVKGIAIGGLVAGTVALVRAGITLNKQYQQQQTTIAAVLAITTKLVDNRGREVSAAEALNRNLSDARGLYQEIRKEAAKTILTQEELAAAFTANLGLGSAAGLTPQQTLRATSRITQLAKSFGLEGERQFAQETRAIFTGEGLQSATVARAIGLTKEDLDRAREAGTLFELITERLKAGDPVIRQYERSFDGLFSTLVSKGQEFIRLSFEKTFQAITGELGSLNDVLTDEKVAEFADKFAEAVSKAYKAIDAFVKGDTFKSIINFFRFIVDNGKAILAVFAGIKVGQLAAAGATALGGLGVAGAGAAAGPIGLTIATATIAIAAGNIAVDKFTGGEFLRQADRTERERIERLRGTPTGRDVLQREFAQEQVRDAERNLRQQQVRRFRTREELRRREELTPTVARPDLSRQLEQGIRERLKAQEALITFAESRLAGARERFAAVQKAIADRRGKAEIDAARKTQGELNRINAQAAEKERARREKALDADLKFQQALAGAGDNRIAKIVADANIERRELEKQFKGRADLGKLLVAFDADVQRRIREERERTAEREAQILERVRGYASQFEKLERRRAEVVREAQNRIRDILRSVDEERKRSAENERRLIEDRIEAEKSLTRTVQDEARRRIDASIAQARAALTGRVGAAFAAPGETTTGEGPGGATFTRQGDSIQERVRRAVLRQVQAQNPDLTHGQQEQLAAQRTRSLLREQAAALQQPDGMEQVRERFGALGVNLSAAEQQRLAAAAIEGGDLGEQEFQNAEQRAREELAVSLQDAADATIKARENIQNIDTALQENAAAWDQFLQETREKLMEARTEMANSIVEIAAQLKDLAARVMSDKEAFPLIPKGDQQRIRALQSMQLPAPNNYTFNIELPPDLQKQLQRFGEELARTARRVPPKR